MTLVQESVSPGGDAEQATPPLARSVMIVEPLPDQQWKLARMFTVCGYRVIGSASLHAARALLRRFPVDLILLSEDSRAEIGILLAEIADFPDVRIVIMGDGQTEPGADLGFERIAWVRRPARMQDLAALQAAVA